MDPPPRNRPRRWLVLTLKIALALLLVWYIRGTIVEAWQGLGEHRWQLHFGWLVLAGVCYVVAALLCGLFWHRILRQFDQQVELLPALRAYFIGHLGKYVPGKAMVVILRAGLIRGPGVEPSLAVVSVFLETLTMMSVGALMAAGVVVVWFPMQPLLFWSAMGMLLVAGLPTLPPVMRRLARLAFFGRVGPVVVSKLQRVGYRTALLGWLLNTLGWAILGVSLWAVMRSLGAETSVGDWMRLTGAVALATVAGFVSFLPGGAVVREAVLAEMLAPGVGSALALVSAILLRLVWLGAELAISSILMMVPRAKRESPR